RAQSFLWPNAWSQTLLKDESARMVYRSENFQNQHPEFLPKQIRELCRPTLVSLRDDPSLVRPSNRLMQVAARRNAATIAARARTRSAPNDCVSARIDNDQSRPDVLPRWLAPGVSKLYHHVSCKRRRN